MNLPKLFQNSGSHDFELNFVSVNEELWMKKCRMFIINLYNL